MMIGIEWRRLENLSEGEKNDGAGDGVSVAIRE
jgi:hypothetical protein